MFKVSLIKDGKVILQNDFVERFKDYKEDIINRLENKVNKKDIDLIMLETIINGKAVKKDEIKYFMMTLRNYDEVGISNDIYEFLDENKKEDFEYILLGTSNLNGIIDLKKYHI